MVDFFAGMVYNITCTKYGGVAQLGARLNGIQKVEGSIPFISTKNQPDKAGFFIYKNKGDRTLRG